MIGVLSAIADSLTFPMANAEPELTLDAQLAERAIKGDKNAFSQLVQRYQRPVRALCMRYLRSSEADDAAQETFVRAFLHFKDFDATRPLLPWLATIGRRLCLDRLRRRKFEGGEVSEMTPSREPSAEDATATNEQMRRLQKAMNALPEGPREALSLFHFEELSYQEIADALQVPMGTVMTWIYRAREELRRACGEAK